MNYAEKYDHFFPFFIKVVVNESKVYSFPIISMMHLQKKILLSVIMLRFHFFTAKQGTWVHKYDRGPCNNLWRPGDTIARFYLGESNNANFFSALFSSENHMFVFNNLLWNPYRVRSEFSHR